MNNPVIHAFFVGRALAELIGEKAEEALTNTLSELGKFDAEQRENLRQFTEEVIARADREAAKNNSEDSTAGNNFASNGSEPADLQETIDELRAEIARLRSEIKRYSSQSA